MRVALITGAAAPDGIGSARARALALALAGEEFAQGPEDVARVAAFLASDDADYINGANIVVDGGVSVMSG